MQFYFGGNRKKYLPCVVRILQIKPQNIPVEHIPLKEQERLEVVTRFLTLNIDKKHELDAIVRLAAEICNTSVALITILDDQTQHIKFRFGYEREETKRQDAFCHHTIQDYKILEVPDAARDERFVNNPLVTGDPNIRFYAGHPLTTRDGHNLGSLCVIDNKPGSLSDFQRKMLQILSQQVIRIVEFEMGINLLREQFDQVKQSEIKLRSFFESSVSCHLLLGKNFEILAFNKPLLTFIKEIFGTTVKEGMDIRSFVHEQHQTFMDEYRTALSGEPVISEKEFIYPHRVVYWYLTYEPAYDERSEVIGVSLNATDITQRIAQEKLVFSQNESLRKIAYIQSHEVRKPVSSILGLMALIKQEDYYQGSKELVMLEQCVKELDLKIHEIVGHTV
jgi:PAS domain S-box-containing protein